MPAKCASRALFFGLSIAGGMLVACRTAEPTRHSTADSGVPPAVPAVVSSARDGLDVLAESASNPRCECRAPSATEPISANEIPIRGEVVSISWFVGTLYPVCAERLLCLGGRQNQLMDQTHLEMYWSRYKVTHPRTTSVVMKRRRGSRAA